MRRLILTPIFALSEEQDAESQRINYCVWMGPTLDDIMNFQKENYTRTGVRVLKLLGLTPEEVFTRIEAHAGTREVLNDGIKDYNTYHGESAILLYVSDKPIF